MAVPTFFWRLASPYDAYVAHVGTLNDAIARIRDLTVIAQRYEAGLEGSVRFYPGGTPAALRAERFRERLAGAAAMSDEEFEEFLALLGGGTVAQVEADRAQAASRMTTATRGLEEYFAIAGHELAILEERGYDPRRGDVARHLRDNRLPETDLAGYRHQLHELGILAGSR